MSKKITKSLIKKLIEQQLQKRLNEQPAIDDDTKGAIRRASAAAATGVRKAIRKGEESGLPDGMAFFDIIKSIPQGDCEKVVSVLKQVIKPVIDADPGADWYGEIIQVLEISNQNPGFKPETMKDLSFKLDGIFQKMGGFKIPGYTGGSIDTMTGEFEEMGTDDAPDDFQMAPEEGERMGENKQPLMEVLPALGIYGGAIAVSLWIYYASKSDDPEKPTKQEIKQFPSSDLSKAIAAILLNPGGSRPKTVYDIVATIVAFMTGCTGLISWIPRVPKKKDDKPDDGDGGGGGRKRRGGGCSVFYAEAVRATGMPNYKDATMLIQALLVGAGESPKRGEEKVSSLMDMESSRSAAIEAFENKEKIRNKIDIKQRRKLGIDGICGKGTMDAVKRIQKKIIDKGIDLGSYGPNRDGVDGIVGQKTMPYLEDFAFSRGDLDGSDFGAQGVPSPGKQTQNFVLNAPPAPEQPESLEESEIKQIREHFARWEKLWK